MCRANRVDRSSRVGVVHASARSGHGMLGTGRLDEPAFYDFLLPLCACQFASAFATKPTRRMYMPSPLRSRRAGGFGRGHACIEVAWLGCEVWMAAEEAHTWDETIPLNSLSPTLHRRFIFPPSHCSRAFRPRLPYAPPPPLGRLDDPRAADARTWLHLLPRQRDPLNARVTHWSVRRARVHEQRGPDSC